MDTSVVKITNIRIIIDSILVQLFHGENWTCFVLKSFLDQRIMWSNNRAFNFSVDDTLEDTKAKKAHLRFEIRNTRFDHSRLSYIKYIYSDIVVILQYSFSLIKLLSSQGSTRWIINRIPTQVMRNSIYYMFIKNISYVCKFV